MMLGLCNVGCRLSNIASPVMRCLYTNLLVAAEAPSDEDNDDERSVLASASLCKGLCGSMRFVKPFSYSIAVAPENESVQSVNRRERERYYACFFAWVDVRPVHDHISEHVHIKGCNGFSVGELLGKDFGQPNFVHVDVRVGRDDGAGRKVHTFAHHVHAK